MKNILWIAVCALFLSSCEIITNSERIRGNGNITTKEFRFVDFHKIDVSNAIDIKLTQGNEFKVVLEGDDNLLQYVDVQSPGNELRVAVKDGYSLSPTEDIVVHITMPAISYLRVSGACDVNTTAKFEQKDDIRIDMSGASDGDIAIRAPKVNITLSGATTLDINGETKELKVDVSGASTLNGFNLLSETTVGEASGASTARIFGSVALKLKANGASTTLYKGEGTVEQESSSASTIRKD